MAEAEQKNDTVHCFNVKPTKMLSDPVAEAFGLIHHHPSGENFCRVNGTGGLEVGV